MDEKLMDMEFLNQSENRDLKILIEYRKAKAKFAQLNIQNCIAFFGSARILSPELAATEIVKHQHDIQKMNSMATQIEMTNKYYKSAKDLSYKIAMLIKEYKLEEDLRIITGGGPGIMEAANRGAYDANINSLGLNIQLPFEQTLNKYVDKEFSITFEYFFMRKFFLTYFTKIFVIFPGGFGTMDELFEIITLIQTNKKNMELPIIFFDSLFFKKMLEFIEEMEKNNLISNIDKQLLCMVDSVDDAFSIIKNHINNHFMKKI